MTKPENISPLIMIPWVLMCLAVWTVYWKGRTLVQNPPWVRINFCPKCGASLEQDGA
jgi:hypothetical protein